MQNINLPEGWTLETSPSYGVIIQAPGPDGGYVTVSESARNFTLGISIVRTRGDYNGRGWQDRMYAAAIAALKAAMARQADMRAKYSGQK